MQKYLNMAHDTYVHTQGGYFHVVCYDYHSLVIETVCLIRRCKNAPNHIFTND